MAKKTQSTEPEVKKLYRSRTDKILGGVCGGIAKHYNLDPVIVRIGWIILGLLSGIGLLAYIAAWIIIPQEPLEEVSKKSQKSAKN